MKGCVCVCVAILAFSQACLALRLNERARQSVLAPQADVEDEGTLSSLSGLLASVSAGSTESVFSTNGASSPDVSEVMAWKPPTGSASEEAPEMAGSSESVIRQGSSDPGPVPHGKAKFTYGHKCKASVSGEFPWAAVEGKRLAKLVMGYMRTISCPTGTSSPWDAKGEVESKCQWLDSTSANSKGLGFDGMEKKHRILRLIIADFKKRWGFQGVAFHGAGITTSNPEKVNNGRNTRVFVQDGKLVFKTYCGPNDGFSEFPDEDFRKTVMVCAPAATGSDTLRCSKPVSYNSYEDAQYGRHKRACGAINPYNSRYVQVVSTTATISAGCLSVRLRYKLTLGSYGTAPRDVFIEVVMQSYVKTVLGFHIKPNDDGGAELTLQKAQQCPGKAMQRWEADKINKLQVARRVSKDRTPKKPWKLWYTPHVYKKVGGTWKPDTELLESPHFRSWKEGILSLKPQSGAPYLTVRGTCEHRKPYGGRSQPISTFVIADIGFMKKGEASYDCRRNIILAKYAKSKWDTYCSSSNAVASTRSCKATLTRDCFAATVEFSVEDGQEYQIVFRVDLDARFWSYKNPNDYF